jgi:4,5-DOPA dioxygenase extradiol
MLMPTLFIGHGSPMYALEPNQHTQAWTAIAQKIPRPSAILMISAHWYTRGIWLTAMQYPNTIHDFSGFPQELFDFQYPAPGSPELAFRVRDLLLPSHSNITLEESEWGLDHGSWSILKYMYPNANIPVVQMSMDATLTNAEHFLIGQVLQQLRQEGVLILSSGNVVHNLGLLSRSTEDSPPKWASGFNDFFKSHLLSNTFQPITEFNTSSPYASMACPTPEHYLPALYTLGLKMPIESAQIISDGIEMSSISMLSFGFGLTPTQ